MSVRVFLRLKYYMRANIREHIDLIPGTSTIYYDNTKVGIAITDLQVFYTHAEQTVDLVEVRRLWIEKNKR